MQVHFTRIILAFVCLCGLSSPGAFAAPHFATGIKVGEVTPTTAIVWTRLTKAANAVPADGPKLTVTYTDENGVTSEEFQGDRFTRKPTVIYPEGATVDTLAGAAPGTSGSARVRYTPKDTEAWKETAWMDVDPARDFTAHIPLSDLTPATEYRIVVESRGPDGTPGDSIDGRFETAPTVDDPYRVVFTVTTGQKYDDQDAPGGGFKIYDAMAKLKPCFFVHTGDILYYDQLAKNVDLARWHWSRMYSLPTNVAFHRIVDSYFMKDDHDTWQNDCWPTMGGPFMGDLTFVQGQAIFLEQVPMSEKTYRTFRWGKDLQIWLVEGRDFRSPNDAPDGPEKTIWGAEQIAWFKKTVGESDATFRVLISPTPLVGPDRGTKNDNHANAGFTHEGNDLRAFIAAQRNMIVICGDRHWQYVSADPTTGIREYSCGPASNEHAGGWKPEDTRPEHRYLRVTGGFLAVTVDRASGAPLMTLRHHGVDGDVLNEDWFQGK